MKLTVFKTLADSLGLKPRAREAVWLMEIEGMSRGSVACQLDISPSTVSRAHSRFCRAACGNGSLAGMLLESRSRRRA